MIALTANTTGRTARTILPQRRFVFRSHAWNIIHPFAAHSAEKRQRNGSGVNALRRQRRRRTAFSPRRVFFPLVARHNRRRRKM
jgi:hypothetical protein